MPRIFPPLLVVAILLATPLVSAGEERTDKRTAADLHALPAAEFFALPETQQPLLPGRIDEALLDAAVFHATNQVRVEHDLPPLRFDDRLRAAAEMHVRSMIEHGYLAHENPHDEDLRTPMHRVLKTGYTPRSVSENLAQIFRVRYEESRPYYRYERDGEAVFSYDPDGEPLAPHTYESLARELLQEWMNSPGHRENVLREASEELGAAVRFRFRDQDLDEAISVQVFATPRAE